MGPTVSRTVLWSCLLLQEKITLAGAAEAENHRII